MGVIRFSKVVSNLPQQLEPDTIYLVRTGNGFDLYCTDATGSIAYQIGNAATATRLQTARTITIGNTGKSFDGSANVSWSLAEIGAAGFGLLPGVDLNVMVNPGFYRLHDNLVNAPPTVEYGQLIVARGGLDTILQIVTGYNNGEIYWRQGNPPEVGGTGSWSAWHRFYHSGNLGAASETASGIVELATTAEAQALASAVVALTPARLADAFKGANQSLSGNGYQKLPGGLIIQWGYVTCSTSGPVDWTYPLAFPNQVLCVGHLGVLASVAQFAIISSPTLVSVPVSAWNHDGTGSANNVFMLAIGY